MKNSSELILVALKLLACTQKTLAEKLDVSPTQITKWKSGEYMSIDMRKKLEGMLDLNGMPPNMVLMSGSVENATEWMSLIQYLASLANERSETGYDTAPLSHEFESGSSGWSTFFTLNEMGVTLPSHFPNELKNIKKMYDDDFEHAHHIMLNNPYSLLIYNIYLNLNDVYGFYAAYINELMIRMELDLYDTDACQLEPGLLDLAASKLDDKHIGLATNFRSFRCKINKEFEEWLTIIKLSAIQHNVPLRAELLDMVYKSSDALGHNAEGDSLGFNNTRLHPDIYMNELLIGMRTMHAVLPLILEKLGIDDFELGE